MTKIDEEFEFVARVVYGMTVKEYREYLMKMKEERKGEK